MRSSLIGVILVLVAACPSFAQKEARGSEAPQSDESVLAVVNDKKITVKDFEEAVSSLPPQQQLVALQNREDFLDSLIKRELVYQEANRRQLAKDPEVAALLANVQKEVLIQALLRNVIEDVGDVDDAEAERFYVENKERFKTPEKVTASHIVLKSEEEAKTTLEDLKNGEDFAALAKERSIGPRAAQGGYLGSVSRGEMPTEFDQVAFNLPVGQLSELVKTPFGFHIIKVSEHIPSKQLGFSEVSGQIQKRLMAQRQQDSVRVFLEELSEKASLEVHPEHLEKLSP